MKIKIIYCSGQVLLDGSPRRHNKQEILCLQDSSTNLLQIGSRLNGLINQEKDLTYQAHILLVPEIITERLTESEHYSMVLNHFTLNYVKSLPKKIKCEVESYKVYLLNQNDLTKNVDGEVINLYEQIHKTIIRYPTATLEIEAHFADESIKNNIYEYFNKHKNLIPEQATLSFLTQSENTLPMKHERSIVGCGLVDLFYREKIEKFRQVQLANETNDGKIDFALFVNYINQKNIFKINLAPINNILITTKNNRIQKLLRLAALIIQIQNVGNISNNQLNQFVNSLTRLANLVIASNQESLSAVIYPVMELSVFLLKYISDQRCTFKGLFKQNLTANVLNAAWLPGIISVLNKTSTLIENKNAADHSELLETTHNLNCYYKKYYWVGMGLVCTGLTLFFATPALLSIILPAMIAFTSYSLALTTMTYVAASLALISGVIEGAFMVKAGSKALKVASNEGGLKKELFYSIRNLKLFFPAEEEKGAEATPLTNWVVQQ